MIDEQFIEFGHRHCRHGDVSSTAANRLHDLQHFGPFRRFRRELQELLEVVRHAIGPARAVLHQPAVVVGVGVRRVELDGAIERLGGLAPVLPLRQHQAHLVMRLGEVARHLHRLLRRLERRIGVVVEQLLPGQRR